MPQLLRHYATLSTGQQIHYLRAGKGDTLLMLHPSPLSANSLMPLIPTMSALADIVAPDLPGYGHSDPLTTRQTGLTPYVEALKDFLDVIGIAQPVIYGNATGAQLAIVFANSYPERCRGLVLENTALFTDQERADFKQHYFPDLTPHVDGRHLQQVWQIVTGLFTAFPWYSQHQQDQLNMRLPTAATLQAIALDYLQAGSDYARAYIAAMDNEKPEPLLAVPVPTKILLWQDSILFAYSQRLLALPLPEHIECRPVASGFEQRLQALQTAWSDISRSTLS